jgi:hypothetical protein
MKQSYPLTGPKRRFALKEFCFTSPSSVKSQSPFGFFISCLELQRRRNGSAARMCDVYRADGF